MDLFKVTDVRPFFLERVKEAFPCVYRLSLKVVVRRSATCFQERVFSTGKRVMSLDATKLGPNLFRAMVSLRHNRKLFQSWMGEPPDEVVVRVEKRDRAGLEMAELLKRVKQVDRIEVFSAPKRQRKG